MRQRNYTEALPLLREAASLDPDNARYGYVYAVALNASGSAAEAEEVLARAHQAHPTDRNVLLGLIAFERDSGDRIGSDACAGIRRTRTSKIPKSGHCSTISGGAWGAKGRHRVVNVTARKTSTTSTAGREQQEELSMKSRVILGVSAVFMIASSFVADAQTHAPATANAPGITQGPWTSANAGNSKSQCKPGEYVVGIEVEGTIRCKTLCRLRFETFALFAERYATHFGRRPRQRREGQRELEHEHS